jgi:hypothetical protein
VREDVDHVLTHDRRESNRGPHVVGEDEKRRAKREQAPVQRHAVEHRAHAVLANAEMHVATGVAARLEIAAVFEIRQRGRIQICRATK